LHTLFIVNYFVIATQNPLKKTRWDLDNALDLCYIQIQEPQKKEGYAVINT